MQYSYYFDRNINLFSRLLCQNGTLDDDFIWFVDGKYEELPDKGFESNLSGQEESDEDEYVTVYKPPVRNELVRAFRLKKPETITSLNDFKRALKKYTVNLIAKLNESNPDRVAVLKAKLPQYAKKWAEDFDNIRVYVVEGDDFDVEGTLIIMTQDIPFGQEKPGDKCKMCILSDSVIKEWWVQS